MNMNFHEQMKPSEKSTHVTPSPEPWDMDEEKLAVAVKYGVPRSAENFAKLEKRHGKWYYNGHWGWQTIEKWKKWNEDLK